MVDTIEDRYEPDLPSQSDVKEALADRAPDKASDLPQSSLIAKVAYGLLDALASMKLSQKAERILQESLNEGVLDDLIELGARWMREFDKRSYGYAKDWINEVARNQDPPSSRSE